jgi:outer membrane murein-binding lipoprotein Lpp
MSEQETQPGEPTETQTPETEPEPKTETELEPTAPPTITIDYQQLANEVMKLLDVPSGSDIADQVLQAIAEKKKAQASVEAFKYVELDESVDDETRELVMQLDAMIEFFKEYNHPDVSIDEREWDAVYVNDLPPFTNEQGQTDLPHLRNIIAQMNQLKSTTDSVTDDDLRAKAKATLVPLAKKFLPNSQWANERIDALKTKVTDLTAQVTKLAEDMEQCGVMRESLERERDQTATDYDALKQKVVDFKTFIDKGASRKDLGRKLNLSRFYTEHFDL